MSNEKPLMNERITFSTVRLILSDGKSKGIVSRQEALFVAKEEGLDLVLVSEPSKDQPAVCKILDYSKMLYKQSKQQKHHKVATDVIKEIRISFGIGEHDLETKNNQVKKFLEKKYRVKYVLRLHGRERKMSQEAITRFNTILTERFTDCATWDSVKISYSDISTTLHALTN